MLRYPDADEATIRIELSGNLCRCTGYMGIVAAIRDVLGQCNAGANPEIAALREAFNPWYGFKDLSVSRKPFVTFEAVDTGTVVVSAGRSEEASTHGESSEGGTRIQGHFAVPFATVDVWQFMSDLAAVAACLPGAELTEHVGDRVKGRVAIKFGPMSANFNGAARLERDDASRSAILKGAGQDALSQSRASGDVAYRLSEAESGSTRCRRQLVVFVARGRWRSSLGRAWSRTSSDA